MLNHSTLTFTKRADIVRLFRWQTHAESTHSQNPETVNGERQEFRDDIRRYAIVRVHLRQLVPSTSLADPKGENEQISFRQRAKLTLS